LALVYPSSNGNEHEPERVQDSRHLVTLIIASLPGRGAGPHPVFGPYAVSTLIADFFGTTRVTVAIDSKAFSDGLHQHTLGDTWDLVDELFWAWIYAGFHFYYSLEAGQQLGPVGRRPSGSKPLPPSYSCCNGGGPYRSSVRLEDARPPNKKTHPVMDRKKTATSIYPLPQRLRPIQHHCKCGPAGCGWHCDQESLAVQRGLICPVEVAGVHRK
jgi:hypothetical protein